MEDTGDCAKHYICVTVLFLFSTLSQAYDKILYHGLSSPGHVIEVVNGFNDNEKSFILQLMETVHILGFKGYYTKKTIHSETHKSDVILAREFLKSV